MEDINHSTEEERFYCIGRVGDGIMTVRFTYRGHVIRIYGAGYWRRGRNIYEEQNKIDILRNCNLGNTLKDTFILNSSRCQPEVNEGSNISKSLIVINDFVTVDLCQNLVLFHTT